MNNTKQPYLNPHSNLIIGPAYPHRARAIISALKQHLDYAECAPGNHITQLHFGHLLGAARSTASDWFSSDHANQVVRFVAGLERLSDSQVIQLRHKICRDCPRLSHPRLSHDLQAVAALHRLLKRSKGLTIIVSASEELRTFVATALGNSATVLDPRKRVCGLDAHLPIDFVPVPGVFYYDKTAKAATQQALAAAWPVIRHVSKSMRFFNSVWSAEDQYHERILQLAESAHVLLADRFDPESLRQFRQKRFSTQIIRAAVHAKHPRYIQIRVESL